MLNHSLKALSLAAALALAATAASAQTPPPPPKPVTRIGVTPEDSQEAVHKAAPNATATLVRTEPSATEKARAKTPPDKSSAKPAKATPAHTEPNQRANTAPTPSSAANNKTTGTVNNTTTPSAAMGITGTVPGNPPTTGDGSQSMDSPDKSSSGTPTKP